MNLLRAFLHPLLAWSALCLTLGAQPPATSASGDAQAHKRKSTYEDWVRGYTETDLLKSYRERGIFSEKKRAWVTIIAFAGKDGLDDLGDSDFYSRGHCYGIEITADGAERSFRLGGFGMKGGSNPPSPVLLKRVTPLVRKLPADCRTVPPVERCVVVRIEDKKGVRIFLYDMADAPEPFLELLRAIGSSIATWAPHISPVRKTRVHEEESSGIFALSPDGKHVAVAPHNRPLRLWDTKTFQWVRDIPMRYHMTPREITFSPDGVHALLGDYRICEVFNARTWQSLSILEKDRDDVLVSPQFSPDGRTVLFRRGRNTMQAFDARTWKPIQTIPQVPPLSVAWVPAPKGPLAIIQNSDSQILLWDSATSRKVAMLDDFARIERVAFSPDLTRVAVATRHRVDGKYWTPCRIRIWECGDGKLLSELHPFSNDQCEEIVSILWSPDGRYAIVPVRGRLWTPLVIKIWDATTGRHRGTLDGVEGNPSGAAILPGGERLIASTGHGMLYEWDLVDALRKIHAFEASLARPPQEP